MPDSADKLYDASSSLAHIGSRIRTGIIPAPGVYTLNKTAMQRRGLSPAISIGEYLRDDWWQKFPLLPGLVSSFIQIATSREWTVTGKPRLANKAVERLNGVVYVDNYGQLYEGWSALIARLVIDWLMLGINGIIVPNENALIQYIDPAEVVHNPGKNIRPRVITGNSIPVWKDYTYLNQEWSNKQIFFNYYAPYGYLGAMMAPLVPAIPLARLLYLVQQHDMSSVDGRKVKDIFLVADDNIKNELVKALRDYADMYTEADPEKHGIPIIALNKRGGFSERERVEDHIAMLGISKVPEGLERNDLWDQAAIEFSALTGMQVSEWYHVKSGADNRATERVNQERGRTKGPNYFNRQNQRFINSTGILGKTLFQYVEEVDVQAQKDKAEVMLRLSEAVKNLTEAVGIAISARSLIRWLQHLGVFPTDDYLIDDILQVNEDPVKPSDMVSRPIEELLAEQEARDRQKQIDRELEDAELNAEKQRLLIEAQQAAAPPENEEEEQAVRSVIKFVQAVHQARTLETRAIPDYGEVVVNSDGHIIDSRRVVYPVAKLVEAEIEEELVAEYVDASSELDRVVQESFGF